MLEPMRKLLTELHFKGPVDEESVAVPWIDVLVEAVGNEAGLSLKGARHKEGITQRQLSLITRISQRHISEMENGKRVIGEQNAKILANVLGIDYRVFL